MNHTLMVVALLVVVAGSSVQARGGGHGGGGGGHGGGGGSHGKRACHKALEPTEAERATLKAAITTCIAEQPGLQAIITGLGGSGHHWKHGGGGHRDVATLLENNGYATNATTLRTCFAREIGLVKTDGTFDMDTFKASILAKVTGLPIATNTQLGLTNCPEVVNFNVVTYLQCIRTYCETGVAG